MRTDNKEKNIIDTGLENKERKTIRGIKMRIITCFHRKRYFLDNCLGLSDEDNSVSRTDNFPNVFNSVTSRVFSYRRVLHYFLTMPVGFNITLT